MSRIILKKLLNLTEQAPQPPLGDLGGSPAPVLAPPSGANAGGLQPTPNPETPAPDSVSPEPEDPAEYDFTRDFRAFEDKKNKAEADAKKMLLDKMNKRLLNKTIVANASRGYGQPKTDYTISNVGKISVEFWYKDYVVIVTDDKDKKYFLTPGINIKIEGEGSEPAPNSKEQPGEQPGQENPETPQQTVSPEPQSPVPNAPVTDNPEQPEPSIQGQETPNPVKPAVPAKAPAPQQIPQQNPEEEDPNNPKKKTIPESLQKDLNNFLLEFMSNSIKNSNGFVNFKPYISNIARVLSENKNTTKYICKLLIPENHMMKNVDLREIRLSAIDSTNKNTYYGQYSKGSVNIAKEGRYYLLEYVKEIGWNI